MGTDSPSGYWDPSGYYRRALLASQGTSLSHCGNQNCSGFLNVPRLVYFGSLLRRITQHLCHWLKTAMMTSALFKTPREKNIRFS